MAHFRLLDLPREILRLICLHIYDPMELSQQDRLTWGIFSTVDMHQERQDDLFTLVQFGYTCRKVRREVRTVIFRCIRTPTISHAQEVIANSQGWGKLVRSIIIDLSMFDQDDNPCPPISGEDSNPPGLGIQSQGSRAPRSCWSESALLVALINSLPCLEHMSFFADASDDSTLSLFFAALIQHPSLHLTPPITQPPSPPAFADFDFTNSDYSFDNISPTAPSKHISIPLTDRLKSFGWRQRAAPPSGFRQFSQSTTFVSILHLLRHAHRLSFLVLDADMDELTREDVLAAVRELSLRAPPIGGEARKVSLMLCGPIRNWGDGFLRDLVSEFKDIKELFIDRPLRKHKEAFVMDTEKFITLLSPLIRLTHLRLLQIGSYTFPTNQQTTIIHHLARTMPSLLVVGLLNEEGETYWWGIWRRTTTRRNSVITPGDSFDKLVDIRLVPLGDGHLRMLEEEAEEWNWGINLSGLGGREKSIVSGSGSGGSWGVRSRRESIIPGVLGYKRQERQERQEVSQEGEENHHHQHQHQYKKRKGTVMQLEGILN